MSKGSRLRRMRTANRQKNAAAWLVALGGNARGYVVALRERATAAGPDRRLLDLEIERIAAEVPDLGDGATDEGRKAYAEERARGREVARSIQRMQQAIPAMMARAARGEKVELPEIEIPDLPDETVARAKGFELSAVASVLTRNWGDMIAGAWAVYDEQKLDELEELLKEDGKARDLEKLKAKIAAATARAKAITAGAGGTEDEEPNAEPPEQSRADRIVELLTGAERLTAADLLADTMPPHEDTPEAAEERQVAAELMTEIAAAVNGALGRDREDRSVSTALIAAGLLAAGKESGGTSEARD